VGQDEVAAWGRKAESGPFIEPSPRSGLTLCQPPSRPRAHSASSTTDPHAISSSRSASRPVYVRSLASIFHDGQNMLQSQRQGTATPPSNPPNHMLQSAEYPDDVAAQSRFVRRVRAITSREKPAFRTDRRRLLSCIRGTPPSRTSAEDGHGVELF